MFIGPQTPLIYLFINFFVCSTRVFCKPHGSLASLPLHRQQCGFLFLILMFFFISFSLKSSLFQTLILFVYVLVKFCVFYKCSFPMLCHFLPAFVLFFLVNCNSSLCLPDNSPLLALATLFILIFVITLPTHNQNWLFFLWVLLLKFYFINHSQPQGYKKFLQHFLLIIV